MATLQDRRAVLLDIDGTTLLGTGALPGARALVDDLRERSVPLVWLTNNTSRSRDAWCARLADAGFDPRPDELYTAGDATIDFLKGKDPRPSVWLVGPPGLADDFTSAGLVIDDAHPDVVVLAYDTTLTYDRIARTAHLLQAGLPYIATHPDPTCPDPDGPLPDVGSFIAMFDVACGRRPTVIGKPEPAMIHQVLARLGVAPGDALMIGDRLATDIRMANSAGVPSCLVLTGATSAEDVGHAPAADRPDQVLASLRDLLFRERGPPRPL
ncbi:MAG: hypothetical protein CMJ83_09440 [Planctomycetes bacterium]|nr:hypothetical protein [Planctomycetota bacterium]